MMSYGFLFISTEAQGIVITSNLWYFGKNYNTGD